MFHNGGWNLKFLGGKTAFHFLCGVAGPTASHGFTDIDERLALVCSNISSSSNSSNSSNNSESSTCCVAAEEDNTSLL